MDTKDLFMKEAIRQAGLNLESLEGGPFGAVIVKDGEIIASAKNSVVSDTDPTAHAEINAIRKASKILGTYDLSGCTLYSSCEPCPMCLSAIWWSRLDACYFAADRKDAARAGFNDQYFYDQIRLSPKERNFQVHQILSEEGSKVFDQWISEGKDIHY